MRMTINVKTPVLPRAVKSRTISSNQRGPMGSAKSLGSRSVDSSHVSNCSVAPNFTEIAIIAQNHSRDCEGDQGSAAAGLQLWHAFIPR